MQEGYIYIAGAMENDGWLQLNGMAIADGGFIKQECERIMKAKKP